MARNRGPRSRKIPNIKADLHVHSNLSDGRYTPEEVLNFAATGGLDLISITDHDALPTIESGWHQINGRKIYHLTGVEVTGFFAGESIHILVYFPSQIPSGFKELILDQKELRFQRYEKVRRDLGLEIPPATHEASLTTHHLAQALLLSGQISTFIGAITYLKKSGLPPIDTPASKILKIAKESGGIAVWAHPPLGARTHLTDIVNMGLKGLESHRPRIGHNQDIFKKMAKSRSLLITGGSDWHGWGDVRLGAFSVDAWVLESFLKALDIFYQFKKE